MANSMSRNPRKKERKKERERERKKEGQLYDEWSRGHIVQN